MDGPLPLELLLSVASSSPSSWYSLVRALKSVALYARYCASFLSRLRSDFLRPVRLRLSSFLLLSCRVLPNGLRSGPALQVDLQSGTANVFSFREDELHGPWRLYVVPSGGKDWTLLQTRTYFRGEEHGVRKEYAPDGSVESRVRVCFGRAMGKKTILSSTFRSPVSSPRK